MLIKRATLYPHSTAATVPRTCEHCGNEVQLQLHSHKSGPMLGIPVVMWFTDKASVSLFRKYLLLCPICDNATHVDRHVAKGLIVEGESQ